jgi:hypothetical protein
LYSPRIVAQKIDRWVAAGKARPEYHSQAECARAVAPLDSLVEVDHERNRTVSRRDPDKSPEATLTQDELAWIENERLLSRIDFRYLVSRYAWIKNEEDRPVRMTPWRSQEIFLDIIGEMEEAFIAILLIILKARQLGLSRIISLIILHRVVFFPD